MAKDVLDTIMSIQPKDSGGGSGETRESVVHRMASDMLSKLPPDYVPHEVIKLCFSMPTYSDVIFVKTVPKMWTEQTLQMSMLLLTLFAFYSSLLRIQGKWEI